MEPRPKASPIHRIKKGGRRRVSLGAAVDAETGEVVSRDSKRMSRRQSTMQSTKNLHSRLRDAEEKKVRFNSSQCSGSSSLNGVPMIYLGLYAEESERSRSYIYSS